MSDKIFEDAFNLLCGEKIGSGVFRDVYKCRLRADLVVKVEINEVWRTFANVKEMNFWSDHQNTSAIVEWLAPCDYMSPDGRILLQRKVTPCEPEELEKLPKMLPAFLTDTKFRNFGWLDGRVVCIDYAGTIPNPSLKMVKANWWQ